MFASEAKALGVKNSSRADGPGRAAQPTTDRVHLCPCRFPGEHCLKLMCPLPFGEKPARQRVSWKGMQGIRARDRTHLSDLHGAEMHSQLRVALFGQFYCLANCCKSVLGTGLLLINGFDTHHLPPGMGGNQHQL